MATRATLILVASFVLVSGCRRTYVDADNDRLPVAVARAVDPSGNAVDSSANDGLGPIFPFAGEPVEVVLDGKKSSDMDGTIAGYRWLSGTLADGGVDRVVPDGEAPSWPDDVAQPHVKLGEGRWSFSLWVTDDEGEISDPDTIQLIVGVPPGMDAGATDE
jgi:hypothetical protein